MVVGVYMFKIRPGADPFRFFGVSAVCAAVFLRRSRWPSPVSRAGSP
jgi:hypothetical protein